MTAIIRLPLLIIVLLASSACSTLHIDDDPALQTSTDPFVGINRRIYSFNNVADKAILRPIAVGYDNVVPNPVQNSVGRFFSNLREPLNIVNNLLQGKVDGALSSTYRFTVNSTIGVFGFFDIAKGYDVEKQREDFGQTLATWGVRPGPYLVLPFLGPSSLRDSLGLIVDNGAYYPIDGISNSSATRAGLVVLNVVHARAGLLDTVDILDNQLDPYLFLKAAYDQNRINSVYNGMQAEQSDEDIDF